MLSLGRRMHPRNFWFITAIVLCHLQLKGQTLTNGLPPAPIQAAVPAAAQPLPDDPGLQALPLAKPESVEPAGLQVSWKADRQTWANKTATLYNVTEFHYKDYVLSADKVVYHQDTTDMEAEGHLHMTGGPDDLTLTADHGEMQLNTHTGRFYDVTGTVGVRSTGRSVVYTTVNPFVFTGRVLVENGEGNYRVVDGTMTNCRLPKPDWRILARQIRVQDQQATTTNAHFTLLGIPIFYLPWLRHPTDEEGRESGFLIPVIPSNYNSIRGFTTGEQVYWVINRSMDMVIGSEYYSKRGFAPNGDFRYRGLGLDHLTARWNALLDRGIEELVNGEMELVNQGGVDVVALGRKDFSPETRISGSAEYLSSYTYRLVFNDNYWIAITSLVKSDVAVTNAHNGLVSSLEFYRIQDYASSAAGNEASILKLPSLRYVVLDRPLGAGDGSGLQAYWGMDSSLAHLGRSEPDFHAHNEGRFDLYPHIWLPIVVGGWSIVPEAAFRETFYTGSQIPDLTGLNNDVPYVSHVALNRIDGEASVDVRPPAVERDFSLGRSGWTLRHVIEPELSYRFIGGIGAEAQDVLQFDTTDIVTNTNEVGYSLTQRFYLRPPAGSAEGDCVNEDTDCAPRGREWASWQIAQRYYFDSDFGGALIDGRRNVLETALDLTGVTYLTGPRSWSPVISRLRFEAVPNLRVEWDLDYDPKAGRLNADNVFAGYSKGLTTVGLGYALLNAVDETGTNTVTQSRQINPFLEIGKQNRTGFNMAANAGYDFAHGILDYAGVMGVYNWNCCGISVGYRRFDLGSVRTDDVQYLYGFTFANFGSVGDVRHSTTIFRDPTLPPAY